MGQNISSYAQYQSTDEQIQGLTEQSKEYSEIIRGVLDAVSYTHLTLPTIYSV